MVSLLNTNIVVEQGNDDMLDPIGYWFETGEGWDDIPPDAQARIKAWLKGDLTEAVLKEHPGHGSQLVHGNRGGVHNASPGPGVGPTPTGKHVLRRTRPGGAGVFGREAPGWQDDARKGRTTRVFGTATEKALVEGPVGLMVENTDGTSWVGVSRIGGHTAFCKPANGDYDGQHDADGVLAPRVDDDGVVTVPGGTGPERELAAHYIDKALGGIVGTPAAVVRTGVYEGKGILYSGDEFEMTKDTRWSVVEDAGAHITAVGGTVARGYVQPTDVSPSEQRKLALFDSLIGNTDRHPDNYIGWHDKAGAAHITPIDHALSFPRRSGWGNSIFQTDSHRLNKSERALVTKVYKNRAKVRRDLRAILHDDEAVDGFFHRLEFVNRTGRTIDVYDIGKTRSSRPRSGDWSVLSQITA